MKAIKQASKDVKDCRDDMAKKKAALALETQNRIAAENESNDCKGREKRLKTIVITKDKELGRLQRSNDEKAVEIGELKKDN